MKKIKKLEVIWADAKLYSRGVPNKFELKPTLMKTVGLLHLENEDGIYIENPKTIYIKTKILVKKQIGATFLFIPRGMIIEIK